jgi:hypothetical protein
MSVNVSPVGPRGLGVPVCYDGVTISPLPAPSPTTNVIVRVVVVHAGSGTNWITLAIAIAGLALSLTSIGWQAFAFRRSGHRIHVRLKVGILSGGGLGELIYKGYPSLGLMDDMVKRGFTLVVIAIIRNDGRQAVTVEMCEWRTNTTGTAGTVAGDPLPRQLEAGASCRVAFYLAGLLKLFSLSGAAPKQHKRKISVIIHLGTGGHVRSKPLSIPLEAMRYQYSGLGVSNQTSSGVGWPGSAPVKSSDQEGRTQR